MRALCALLALLAVLPLYAANAEETFKPNARDIPAELAPIPEEYATPARHPGSLVSLEYDTWESFSYAEHRQPLRKTAWVYLPYGYDATRPYRQHRTNKAVGRRMNFSSDASANLEGLLEVSRKICTQQMAEKASPDVPPFCAEVPITYST